MFRRYYLTLFGFLLAIENAFANVISETFFDSLGSILEGLSNLLNNKYAVFGLIFIGILFLTYSILKIPLSMIFKSHQKEANIISIMTSLVSTAGLFFILTQGESDKVEAAIALFGGGVGLTVLSIGTVLLLIAVDRLYVDAFDGERFSRWWVVSISAAGLVSTSLLVTVLDRAVRLYNETSGTKFLSNLLPSLGNIFSTILIGALIYIVIGAFRHGKRKSKEGQEILKDKPEIKKAQHVIKKINENNEKMKKIIGDIRNKIRGGS